MKIETLHKINASAIGREAILNMALRKIYAKTRSKYIKIMIYQCLEINRNMREPYMATYDEWLEADKKAFTLIKEWQSDGIFPEYPPYLSYRHVKGLDIEWKEMDDKEIKEGHGGKRMPHCEKCWNDASVRSGVTTLTMTPLTQQQCYEEIIKEREGNPCSKRERAGKFWDATKQQDKRIK